jgi:hypothetical protein
MAYHTNPTSVRAIFAGIVESKRTEYRGIVMRSRLEANFARLLDNREVVWQYEPAVYGPKGRGYLPDFQIERPDGYHFIEVKPTLREVPRAKERMTVIWDVHPSALLIVVSAEECRWFAAERGGPWRSWVELWKYS